MDNTFTFLSSEWWEDQDINSYNNIFIKVDSNYRYIKNLCTELKKNNIFVPIYFYPDSIWIKSKLYIYPMLNDTNKDLYKFCIKYTRKNKKITFQVTDIY